MSVTPLQTVAIAKRRQLAATFGLFAMLFVAVGAVAATGASNGVIKGFVVIALLIAVVLGLIAWGVMRSVKQDLAERRLDAAIEAAVRAQGQSMCECGHEHDPTEMHYVHADACAHDGTGTACSHSCDTCVLAGLRRPSPEPAARRPSPAHRRPSPVRR